MEVYSYVFIDFWGTKFERKMFCHLVSSMLDVDDDNEYNIGCYGFSYKEEEDCVSISTPGDGIFEDNDIVDRGIDIANVFASIFPHSHFVYFAYLDFTYDGSGIDVTMVKYDGENMITFGPVSDIATSLYEYDETGEGEPFVFDSDEDDGEEDETGESEPVFFNPDVVKAIRSRIAPGNNVFGIKYYQKYESDGDLTTIMESLYSSPELAIEYVSSPTVIQPDQDKGFLRTCPYSERVIEMDSKILMLQAMEKELCSGEDSGKVSEYLETLPEEMITSVIQQCDAELYPHALKELQIEIERRKKV